MENSCYNIGGQPQIEEKSLSGDIFCGETAILNYCIRYPKACGMSGCGNICAFYNKKAQSAEKIIRRDYAKIAKRQFDMVQANDSFGALSVDVSFDIMYNDNGLLSLFSDTYEQLGFEGQGLYRSAQTWDLRRGGTLDISELFRRNTPWKAALLGEVEREIATENAENCGKYHKSVNRLLRSEFKTNNFYLSADGLTLFFAEEAIASKNAGLPSFFIPYKQIENMLRRLL